MCLCSYFCLLETGHPDQELLGLELPAALHELMTVTSKFSTASQPFLAVQKDKRISWKASSVEMYLI